jgi:hypothetical protein
MFPQLTATNQLFRLVAAGKMTFYSTILATHPITSILKDHVRALLKGGMALCAVELYKTPI